MAEGGREGGREVGREGGRERERARERWTQREREFIRNSIPIRNDIMCCSRFLSSTGPTHTHKCRS